MIINVKCLDQFLKQCIYYKQATQTYISSYMDTFQESFFRHHSVSYLFEPKGKEAIVLSANRNTAEIGQRYTGLYLTCLLISQNKVVLGQEENSWSFLKCEPVN